MTVFTKSEQRFLLFLLLTFIVGLATKFIRKSIEKEPNEKWVQQRQQILADFEKKSLVLNEENSGVHSTTDITKETLTQKININVASQAELETLPRIGPATAQKIISFREINGPFKTVNDIQKVNSIGPKTLEKIKEFITID